MPSSSVRLLSSRPDDSCVMVGGRDHRKRRGGPEGAPHPERTVLLWCFHTPNAGGGLPVTEFTTSKDSVRETH